MVTGDWLNDVQEEIVSVIIGAGIALDGTKQDQLLKAIQTIAANQTQIETDFIGGGAMTPATTGGISLAVIETGTNKQDFAVAVFAGDADSTAEFSLPMPENWNRGTVKAKILWTPEDGATVGEDVVWTLKATSISEGEALDVSFAAAGVTISDKALGDGKLHLSAASAELTVEGAPALGDLIHFRLMRDVSQGTSPMPEACRVIGIWIQYTCNEAVTAW